VRGEDGLNKQRAQVVGNELYFAIARSMNSLKTIGRVKASSCIEKLALFTICGRSMTWDRSSIDVCTK